MAKVCALTGNPGKFVKSHLYPQAFYELSKDGAPFKLIGGDISLPPKTSWNGVYDGDLVTEEGEKILADLDDYAARVLMPRAAHSEFFHTAEKLEKFPDGRAPMFGSFSHLDVERLTLFFASILWRFGASGCSEANGTELGPYLEKLRDAVVRNVSPSREYFGVSIVRIIDLDAPLAFTPARYKSEGVNMWELIFGNYKIDIRCDRRRPAFPQNFLEMRAQSPVLIMAYEYTKSRSFKNMAQKVQQSGRLHGWPWGSRW